MKWLPETFRSRLALAIGAMALCVGAPFYLYITHIYGQQLVREREQALHDLAESVASVVSLNLGERLREIGLVARMSPELAQRSAAGEAGSAKLNELQATYPVYAWIGASDVEGVVQVRPVHPDGGDRAIEFDVQGHEMLHVFSFIVVGRGSGRPSRELPR